jgi:hypothetical protein
MDKKAAHPHRFALGELVHLKKGYTRWLILAQGHDPDGCPIYDLTAHGQKCQGVSESDLTPIDPSEPIVDLIKGLG